MYVSVYRESRAAGLIADVGLRSKQGRGHRGLYSSLYDPSELGDEIVSLRAKVLSPRGKYRGE